MDPLFDAAAAYVAGAATSGHRAFTDKKKLEFYGLYKQATSGKCSTSRPGMFDFAGRAKWDAWNALGDMSSEDAMDHYVARLTELVPDWDGCQGMEAGPSSKRPGGGGGGMGPVFSSFAVEPDEDDQGPKTLHQLAAEGDLEGMARLLDSGAGGDTAGPGPGSTPADVSGCDEDGCTALHFAADRGACEAVRLLLSCGADVNARDGEGQTPLHYGAICGHLEVCRLLLELGADPGLEDEGGQAPSAHQPGWDIWPVQA